MARLAPALVLAVVAIVLGAVYGPRFMPGAGPSGVGQPAPLSAFARMLDRAETLEREGNLVAARDRLEEALESTPDDARAGEAWLTLARVQYALGHYGDALHAYETTRAEHEDAWRNCSPETKVRYDLLADTRDEAFEPLVALERARRKGGDAFGELEGIVARRPESMVAREALAAMCAAVREPDETPSRVALLESVRERCSDPTALARVNLELGHAYWRDMDDPGRARSHFTAAAKVDNKVLARLANEALTALDTSAP